MAMAKQIRLGELQLQLMQTLWERGPLSAREITEEMSKTAPVAHSTVQTLLRRLENKGVVQHTSDGRTFLYSAAVAETDVQQSAFRDVFRGMFGGSASLLVAHLIEHESISKEELAALRELVESRAREEGNDPV